MPVRSTPNVRFLRHVLLPVVAGLLAAVLFVACEAIPTDPAMEPERSIASAERMDDRASATALPAGMQVTSGSTDAPFMCVLSTRNGAGASAGSMAPAYTYRYVGLAFDEQLVQAAQGEVMTLTYRLRDEQGQITRQATCRVPAATGVDARLVAWLFPQGLTANMRAVLEDNGSLFNATLHTPVEGEPCYDDPDFVWIFDPEFGWMCDGLEVTPDEPDDDEEEDEPIDIPGGGDDGGGCSPFDCPPDEPGDGDDDLPPAGVPPPPPPSDDCPEDDDDTPAPPEGGDEPCGFDCWDPVPGDDPFDPPGFMSVQSWQTTGTGMAVTFYAPASADCPGDEPSIEQQLKDFLEEHPHALLDIPCDQIPLWQEVANLEIPVTVTDRLENEQILEGSKIQALEDATGAKINMDYYTVTVPVESLPDGQSPEVYLNNLRLNIDDYTPGATFDFYPGLDGESIRWATNPLGTVFSLSLDLFVNGSLVATDFSSTDWIFSTVYTNEDGWHPVSGNRKFGYTHNEDGTATFYTRATDRISTRFFDVMNNLKDVFDAGGEVWEGFQEEIVSDVGPGATVGSVIYRPDYDLIEAILNEEVAISTLETCE